MHNINAYKLTDCGLCAVDQSDSCVQVNCFFKQMHNVHALSAHHKKQYIFPSLSFTSSCCLSCFKVSHIHLYLPVFITALESQFICARAPLGWRNSSLIGVWYASLAIHYLVDKQSTFMSQSTLWKYIKWKTMLMLHASICTCARASVVQI